MTACEKIKILKEQIGDIEEKYCDNCQKWICENCGARMDEVEK